MFDNIDINIPVRVARDVESTYLWNSPGGKIIVISVHFANAVCHSLVIAWLLLGFSPGAWCFCFLSYLRRCASLMVIPSLQRGSDGETIRCCNGLIWAERGHPIGEDDKVIQTLGSIGR